MGDMSPFNLKTTDDVCVRSLFYCFVIISSSRVVWVEEVRRTQKKKNLVLGRYNYLLSLSSYLFAEKGKLYHF